MPILFDLDGTLTDPKPGITRSINHALECLGHPMQPEDDLAWCIGPPLRASFCGLVGADHADQALALYRERFADTGLFENAVYEGIPEALAELQFRNIDLFVATSKPEPYAERILEHFDLRRFFRGVHGSTLDGQRDDKGELIRYALQVENLDPNQTVMVGDREHDIRGAISAGVVGVGVLYGYGSQAELVAAGAQALVETPAEIVGATTKLLEAVKA